GPRIPSVLNLILIFLIGLTVARIIWLLIPAETSAVSTLPTPQNNSSSNTGPTTNFNAILSANMFGRASQDEAPADIDPMVAPDTRLNLKLTGIFASADPEQSRALIKDESGKQRPYSVGDDIPGNAKLYSIHADRVLLERKGRYETLRLEQDKLSSASVSRSNRNLPGTNQSSPELDPAAAQSLSEIRETLLQDPTKAGQYIRLQPVYNQGQLQGYRVYPGKNRQLFKDVGLRAGEMVTSVNGTQLDDPTRALQMLTELSSASQLSVTLERAGKSRTVNLNLNQ
ncbi:MAG: type II secretion system protein GspC, partial [Nevskiales bacterium]